MEIINPNEHKNSSDNCAWLIGRNIYIGILLIVMGSVWLLHNFDIIGERFFDILLSWQMLCIIIGGYLLSLRQWFWGTAMVVVGVIFMIGSLFNIYLPVVKVLLPVLVIMLGVGLMIQRGFKR